MPRPLYDVLLVLHVVVAVISFGSLAIGGLAAAAGRRSGDPAGEEGVARFFREGVDWPARAIFLVPLIGLAMLFGGDRSDAGRPWPWLGLGVWVVAIGVLHAVTWPAERRAQRELATGGVPAFRAACARMEQGAAVTTVCFAVAVALMIWQP